MGIVTGAAGRLGRHIAILFAAEGGTVVINDVNREGSEALAEEIRAAGGTVSLAVGDATTLASASELVEKTVDEFGRIDSIILAGANMAGQRIQTIEEMSEDHFREITLSHVGGHFAMFKAVIPHMKRQRYGRIVAFASAHGMVGDWGRSHYAAGKGAITSLMRTAAIELDAWGINVNALSPAGISSDGGTRMLRERAGDPAGVAPLAVYLASEDAGYMNGHVFEGSGSGRIGLYGPFVPQHYMHNPSGWTLDELREIVPGLFEASYTNEPRQRPAMLPRDPLLETQPGEMVDHLPTGLSPIVSDGLGLQLLNQLGLPSYNEPGPKVTPDER
ncbi:SDR family NAD(P)-dependent oxidoreductase [Arthrobacter sp. D1-29]